MSQSKLVGIITDTSPATAVTAVSTTTITGLQAWDRFSVEADLLGATGGALDVYVQRKVAANLWRDWIHFPQLSAGAAAVKYSVQPRSSTVPIVVGGGTDAAPGVALAANTSVGEHPGDAIRLVFVGGASTSAGAAQTVRVIGWKD